jgi:hypothetical protein
MWVKLEPRYVLKSTSHQKVVIAFDIVQTHAPFARVFELIEKLLIAADVEWLCAHEKVEHIASQNKGIACARTIAQQREKRQINWIVRAPNMKI